MATKWFTNLAQAYNLLSQEENRWNRTISKQMAQDSMAMHQIALASKNIAEATKKDSYAMKTIGIYSFLAKSCPIFPLQAIHLLILIRPTTNSPNKPLQD